MSKMIRLIAAGVALGVAGWSLPAAVVEVVETVAATHQPSGLTVVAGKLALPSPGLWSLVEGSVRGGAAAQLELTLPQDAYRTWQGERAKAIWRERELRAGAGALRSLWWPALEYARRHAGAAPADLPTLAATVENLKLPLERSAYEAGGQADGPFLALLGQVRFDFAPETAPESGWPRNRDLLAVELRPLYDDGKHWVLDTQGRCERREIDRALLAVHGLVVRPLLADLAEDDDMPAELAYSIHALRSGAGAVEFMVVNQEQARQLACRWLPSPAAEGGAEIIGEWAGRRNARWAALASTLEAPVVNCWQWLAGAMFDVDESFDRPGDRRRRRRDAGNTTDLFGVLGGQAAMRETLQLQALQLGAGADQEQAGVPVAEMAGVAVQSHPYAEMLAGRPGGRLAIAEVVPNDRFLVHVARPAALRPLLDQGAGFIASLGAMAVGRSLDYGLEARYLGRLGLERQWVDQLLELGLVSELALFMPDLFLIDGTELTVVCRVPQAALLRPLLAAAGVGELGGGRPVAVDNRRGGQAYWGMAGDLLIVGSSQAEVAAALALAADPEADSLGRSAEFRYLLEQLPVLPETRVFLYFSDSFIRQLVGPQVKIGQLRRLTAKARLQTLAAAALLHRLDGQPQPPTIERLQAAGYLPAGFEVAGLALDERGLPSSATYGSLAGLGSISSQPVELATPAEAAAYQQYLENYTRFWQRFFDPIAVRLDDTGAGELELTTFILPLLDHSLYNRLKEVLVVDHRGPPLRIPQLEPPPVAMLSLKVAEQAWLEFLDDFMRQGRQAGVPLAWRALDDLGPGFHVAIHDGDPIIAFGSGELVGLGGGAVGMDREMLALPLLLSLLTRPCTLLVELRDQAAVAGLLRSGGLRHLVPFLGEPARLDYYQLGEGDVWVYVLDLFGINLRFKFEVRDHYLLIHNLPWGPAVRIGATAAAEFAAVELRLHPAAASQQLAAMGTAAGERQRRLAMQGIGYLLPLVLTGEPVDSASRRHRELFGFAPAHPAGGEWEAAGNVLSSSLYGRPGAERQVEQQPGNRAFGLLQGVDHLQLGLQFEDSGLRTRIRWRYRPAVD